MAAKFGKNFRHFALGIAVNDLTLNGRTILVFESYYDDQPLVLTQDNNEVQIEISNLGLRPGIYEMEIYLKKEKPHANLDILQGFRFRVEDINERQVFLGKSLFYQPRKWQVKINKL